MISLVNIYVVDNFLDIKMPRHASAEAQFIKDPIYRICLFHGHNVYDARHAAAVVSAYCPPDGLAWRRWPAIRCSMPRTVAGRGLLLEFRFPSDDLPRSDRWRVAMWPFCITSTTLYIVRPWVPGRSRVTLCFVCFSLSVLDAHFDRKGF